MMVGNQRIIKKVEKLEQRSEKYLLRMFDLFKGLREAVAEKDEKRARKFQRWEGLYERREWRTYNRLVSKLNKLRKDLPEAEQKIIDDIETKLEINEKKLADELSRRAGEVKKHLKAEDWDALDKEMEEIETTIKSTEAIFENELEPELIKLEKEKVENKRKIMFVDDQWCQEDMQGVIRVEYGPLMREGYEFVYETAFDGFKYSTQKVVDKANAENPCAVVLDMDFSEGLTRLGEGKGFGKKILEALVRNNPKLPVFIHSSSNDETLKTECKNIGAKTWLNKKASLDELKDALNKYCEGA